MRIMRITGKILTDKLINHLNLIENYLNLNGLDVCIEKSVSKSMNGDWVDIAFLTEKYNKKNILNPSNFEPLFEKTLEKTTPVLTISYNDIFGEVNINPVCSFKLSDYKDYYRVDQNLKSKIISYIEKGINIEIRKTKLSKI